MLAGTVHAQGPSVVFEDVSGITGLQLGGGAACWADFDNDGWVDVCAGAVWKNNGGKSFSKLGDIAPGSAVAADFDNDGFVDLFSWSSLKLLATTAETHSSKSRSRNSLASRLEAQCGPMSTTIRSSTCLLAAMKGASDRC
jgi:hypothetical protein